MVAPAIPLGTSLGSIWGGAAVGSLVDGPFPIADLVMLVGATAATGYVLLNQPARVSPQPSSTPSPAAGRSATRPATSSIAPAVVNEPSTETVPSRAASRTRPVDYNAIAAERQAAQHAQDARDAAAWERQQAAERQANEARFKQQLADINQQAENVIFADAIANTAVLQQHPAKGTPGTVTLDLSTFTKPGDGRSYGEVTVYPGDVPAGFIPASFKPTWDAMVNQAAAAPTAANPSATSQPLQSRITNGTVSPDVPQNDVDPRSGILTTPGLTPEQADSLTNKPAQRNPQDDALADPNAAARIPDARPLPPAGEVLRIPPNQDLAQHIFTSSNAASNQALTQSENHESLPADFNTTLISRFIGTGMTLEQVAQTLNREIDPNQPALKNDGLRHDAMEHSGSNKLTFTNLPSELEALTTTQHMLRQNLSDPANAIITGITEMDKITVTGVNSALRNLKLGTGAYKAIALYNDGIIVSLSEVDNLQRVKRIVRDSGQPIPEADREERINTIRSQYRAVGFLFNTEIAQEFEEVLEKLDNALKTNDWNTINGAINHLTSWSYQTFLQHAPTRAERLERLKIEAAWGLYVQDELTKLTGDSGVASRALTNDSLFGQYAGQIKVPSDTETLGRYYQRVEQSVSAWIQNNPALYQEFIQNDPVIKARNESN
jgi:hypothetical protein